MKTIKITTLLLILFFTHVIRAQDSKGTDFWIMFNENGDVTSTLKLYISSDTNTSGAVDIPSISFSTTFTTTVGVITEIDLPAAAEAESVGISDKGIHITSDEEITVYGFNIFTASTDAFLCLPTDALGSEYITLAYNGLSNRYASELGVVATESGTTNVTITPSVLANGQAAGVPFSVSLTQGQTYLMQSNISSADLTGTHISSDKNVAVFSGSQCSNVPVNKTFCDHLVEQLPPLTAWGKDFITIPLATRLNGDTYRFMAQTDNTDVQLNGVIIATLDAGEFHEQIITGYNSISATEPILVAQYSNGASYDAVTADPFMLLVPPTEQFLAAYTFNTGTLNIPINYVNIVAETDHVDVVDVDGVLVPASEWTSIPGTDFSGAQLELSSGQHSIQSEFPVGVFIYGFGGFDSYGYLGGQSFSPIATVTSIIASPETQTILLDEEVCIEAVVLDQFDEPVEDVIVDFLVTGDNSTSGFDNTDVAGVATFCYTPSNGGVDMVSAAIFGLEDIVQVIIEECNMEIDAIVADESCYYENDGSIDLTLSNYTTINSILWSNGATSEDLDGLDNGNYTVSINYDADCMIEMSFSVGTYLENDADCDGVDDLCDECPGGDDSVDNNNDGMPDCKYPPALEDIIDEWKCGKNLNKVLVCHSPPGNPNNAHTSCINYNALESHLDHGDYLGPCGNTSCFQESAGTRQKGDSQYIQLYPNPVSEILHIDLKGTSLGDQVRLVDLYGRAVYVIHTDGNQFSFDIDMNQVNISSGLYFISAKIDGELQIKKVIVQK